MHPCLSRAALVLLVWCLPSGPALAFGDFGGLPGCASFVTCTAAAGSAVTWGVREEVSLLSADFVMPPDLVAGVTVRQGSDTAGRGVLASAGNGAGLPPVATGEFYRGSAARATSNFAVNRVQTSQSRGVSGELTRGSGAATVKLQTFGEASSAWRDVWTFNGAGQLHAQVLIDGGSTLGAVGVFQPSYDLHALADHADWFFDLRVWDVTNQSVSEDFELGGPTPVTRTRINGYNEQRAAFASTLALDFAFEPAVMYVVTAELRATSRDGREIDLFHTARLDGLQLSAGAQLSALSGHDYLAPVPEPAPAVLLLAGLAALFGLRRRQAG